MFVRGRCLDNFICQSEDGERSIVSASTLRSFKSSIVSKRYPLRSGHSSINSLDDMFQVLTDATEEESKKMVLHF